MDQRPPLISGLIFFLLLSNNVHIFLQTVDWVSKLDTQLYPVLKSEPSSVDRHISEVEQKLNNVLPEIQRAQNEIESRIKTAEELIGKG